jgi:hypothetical protein
MKKALIALLALGLLATPAFAKKKKRQLLYEDGVCYRAEFFGAMGRLQKGWVLISPNYRQVIRIYSNGEIFEVPVGMIHKTIESTSCPDFLVNP